MLFQATNSFNWNVGATNYMNLNANGTLSISNVGVARPCCTLTANSTAGGSQGMQINAGKNNTDFNLILQASGGTQFLEVLWGWRRNNWVCQQSLDEGAGTLNVQNGYYLNSVPLHRMRASGIT